MCYLHYPSCASNDTLRDLFFAGHKALLGIQKRQPGSMHLAGHSKTAKESTFLMNCHKALLGIQKRQPGSMHLAGHSKTANESTFLMNCHKALLGIQKRQPGSMHLAGHSKTAKESTFLMNCNCTPASQSAASQSAASQSAASQSAASQSAVSFLTVIKLFSVLSLHHGLSHLRKHHFTINCEEQLHFRSKLDP